MENRNALLYIWLSLVVDFAGKGISEFFKNIYSVMSSDGKEFTIEDSSSLDNLVLSIYNNRDKLQKHLGFLKESERKAVKNFPLKKAEEVFKDCQKNKINIVVFTDTGYPDKLKNIYNPPLVLYRKGVYKNVDNFLSIGVVGTRKPSTYATRATNLISQDLAVSNTIVVSGQALGIDSAAHQGCIDGKGYTVAFAGCGLDVDYPSGNRKLREDITRNGVVYSEYPPKTKPNGWHFPIRNRLISGFCDGVFVTEGYYSSGSIHTAKHALEQGRDVFALPGDVFSPKSEATFRLLKDGASPVMSSLDILEHYLSKYGKNMNFVGVRRNYHGGLGRSAPIRKKESVKQEKSNVKKKLVVISSDQFLTSEDLLKRGFLYEDIQIYNSLISKNKHLDEIINELKTDSSTVLTSLTKLEIEGVVTSLPGKVYGIKNI